MLAGYLAAGFSKTGKIGTYGGQQFPGVTRFMDGLYAGIKYYNEKHGTTVQLLGWDAAKQTGTFVGGDNPWGDPAKGEQLAKTFLDQGVDIVHPVAGATGNGTIKAMLAAGKWAIGVDTDQAISLPEYAAAILTSAAEGHRRRRPRHHQEELQRRPSAARTTSARSPTAASRSPRPQLRRPGSPRTSRPRSTQLQADIASGTVKVADYLK